MASQTTTVPLDNAQNARIDGALKSRLVRVRDALTEGLIERDIPVRLALLAALAGEHMLLIGPPGTAKSELARRLRLAFSSQEYFERLLTRFSVPEELFGPLSIKALEEDKYQRQTAGYLPTASVAFLDEIFKANSAILNSLLTLLNEREFDNGMHRVKTPLVSVVGASNELPQEEELLALYDRFLVRLHIGPVTDDGFVKLLDLRGSSTPSVAEQDRLAPQDLTSVQASALKVMVPSEVASLLKAMRRFCQDQQIPVSDRRWRKALFLLQVAAHTDGRAAVSVWDCWLLQHCLWHMPEEQAALAKWYEERAGAASPREPERFSKIAGAWEAKLKDDKGKVVQKADEKGRPLYRSPGGGEVVSKTSKRKKQSRYGHEEEETVENEPVMLTMSYAKSHIAGRVGDVDAAIREVNRFVLWSDQQAKRLDQDIRGHVWLDPGFAVPAVRNLQEHIRRATDVLARLETVKQGFKQLPVEKDLEFPPDTDGGAEGEQFEVGDKVTFEDQGSLYYGEIRAIDGEEFTVRNGDGEEWTLGRADISRAE